MLLLQIFTTFVKEETEELWERLTLFYKTTLEGKMTKESYFNLMEQSGRPINPSHIPPELSDFPHDVQLAIEVYNKLGDRYDSELGYLGKDYSSLPIHMRIHGIGNEELFLETILLLDSKMIETAARKLKAARDKERRKSGGKK